jgi:hypothetical protein
MYDVGLSHFKRIDHVREVVYLAERTQSKVSNFRQNALSHEFRASVDKSEMLKLT